MPHHRPPTSPGLVALAALAAVLALAVGDPAAGGAGEADPGTPTPSDVCPPTDDPDEPPCNPTLSGPWWGASHRSSYAQASSPFPGPVDDDATARHVALPGIPIQLQFTPPDAQGTVAVWGSLINTQDSRAVVKLDHGTGELVDLYLPAEREDDPPPPATGGITGAYNLLDADGRFLVGRQRSIEVYEDAVAGDHRSPIALARRFELPDRALCRADDVVAGMTMTYDGHVAFVTEQGMVGVVPRQPDRMADAAVVVHAINGDACADPSVPVEDLELVSNSLAADEDGGIYVVTSAQVHRIDWDVATGALTPAWSTAYGVGATDSAIRLGAGSGSTPSLMGTGPDDDRFVVITDGQDVMHLVLLWRDDVPDGWEPVAPGADPRIACQVPVTFGDPAAERTLSEQSVLVSGYATFHVSDLLADESAFAGLDPDTANALAALEGGDRDQAPHGAERIDWDPEARTCRSVWANPDVSIPNGIPTLSRATGLVYGIGQRDGVWGVTGLDADTGEDRLWLPGPNEPCAEEALAGIDPAQRPGLDAVLARLPNSCENSFYAATEIGPDGSVYTGTFLGATSYLPRADPDPTTAPPGTATVAGDDGDDVVGGVRAWPLAAALALAAVTAVGVVVAVRRHRS